MKLWLSLLSTFASMTKRVWRSTRVAMKLLPKPAITHPFRHTAYALPAVMPRYGAILFV
jgi:hypothetical protein